MALLPSSNQILWIRPYLEQLKGAVISFPDVQQPADRETWFSIAYDPDQQFWIARHAPAKAKEFFGLVTGTAKMSGPDLHLYSADAAKPSLILTNYKYITQLAARHFGNAFRGTRKGNLGATLYEQRTRYVREVEYGILTPQEKLSEMTDCALRDPNFSRKMKAEFSTLANPVVLLTICAVMGVFVLAVGGAAALGGAAFAAAFGRLIGIGFLAHQLLEYERLFTTLSQCLKSNEQKDFYKGAETVQQILICMLRDISFSLGLTAAGAAASKAGALLKEVFVKHTPQRWKQLAEEASTAAKNKVNAAGGRFGYAREDLLKPANTQTYFHKGEEQVFLRRSKQNGEMIVIREPSNDRLAVLRATKGWADGKPEWIKAKSSTGKYGIVGFKITDEAKSIVEAGKSSKPYPSGNLKGISPELDAIIAKNPSLPSWEVPYGKTFVEPEKGMKVFDWGAAGANHSLAKGARCVKLGDRYIFVDALGRPICQDLDIGAIAKQGQKMPGEHLKPSALRQANEKAGKPSQARNNPEDDFLAEEILNYQLFKQTGEMANMVKHGGLGGSARHVGESAKAGKGHWSPRAKDGSGKYDAEKLIVFLPVKNGTGMTSSCFEFKGYAELEAFCKANNFPWTF